MDNGLLIVLLLIAIFALYLVWDNKQWEMYRKKMKEKDAHWTTVMGEVEMLRRERANQKVVADDD